MSTLENERQEGTVKWFATDKGYGFIIPDDNSIETSGGDLFVHFSSITGQKGRRNLEENQRVSFIVAQGDKGPQAAEVLVI